MTRRSVFAASGAVGAVFVALGLAGHAGKGFEWRFGAQVMRYADAESDRADGVCNFNLNSSPYSTLQHPQQQCLSSLSQRPKVMLIGDSHMWALADGLRGALEVADISNYFISHTSCLPLSGFDIWDNVSVHDCAEFIEGAFAWALENDISTVVIAARFPLYLRGDRYNNGEGGVETGFSAWVDLQGRTDSAWSDMERRVRVLAAYEQRIRELADRFNVVLVYPVPEAGWNVPSYGFRNAHFNDGDGMLTTSYAAYSERTQEVNGLFDRIVAELPNVHGTRVHEVLCSEITGRCINADADGVYYYDDDHLSNAGARLVAPVIVEAIQDALGNGD